MDPFVLPAAWGSRPSQWLASSLPPTVDSLLLFQSLPPGTHCCFSSPPAPTPQDSLLLFQLVGGCELIKQLPIHLHEGLEHVVDQGHDGSDTEEEV